jgi:hypothetical protein
MTLNNVVSQTPVELREGPCAIIAGAFSFAQHLSRSDRELVRVRKPRTGYPRCPCARGVNGLISSANALTIAIAFINASTGPTPAIARVPSVKSSICRGANPITLIVVRPRPRWSLHTTLIAEPRQHRLRIAGACRGGTRLQRHPDLGRVVRPGARIPRGVASLWMPHLWNGAAQKSLERLLTAAARPHVVHQVDHPRLRQGLAHGNLSFANQISSP